MRDDETEQEARSAGRPDPLDLPWYGTPWPPYLPKPGGALPVWTREGARLCVGPGWLRLVNRAFDIIDPVAHGGVQILSLMHYRGALLIRAGVPDTPDDVLDAVTRYVIEGVAHDLELLSYQSMLTCEVCGDAGDPGQGADARALCREHAADMAVGKSELALWEEYGWCDATRLEHPPRPMWPDPDEGRSLPRENHDFFDEEGGG
jgi:hypothetical protein